MRQCATTLESEISTAEMESLFVALEQRDLRRTHLEIGTAAGGTLCQLASFYQRKKDFSPSFMVVDPLRYFPDQFDIVCRNLANHQIDPSAIDFVKSSSKEAFSAVGSKSLDLDFILVDGNHKIRYVTEDLRWARFLHAGGILCAHDYTPDHPGVYLSINRFLKKHRNYNVISQVGTLLIIEKRDSTPPSVTEVSFVDRLWAMGLAPWFQLKASLDKRIKRASRDA
jgi:predicted O-methyltransferase YrrM